MSVKALDWAFEQELKPGAKFILVALADHADARGTCFPSVSRLMKRTGFGESTVREHLAALRKSGHIRSEERYMPNGRQRSNRIWLPIPGVDRAYDVDEDDDESSYPQARTDPPESGPLPPESRSARVQNLDPYPPESGPRTVKRTVTKEPSQNRETPAGPNAPASARQVAFLGELNERLGGETTAAMTDAWQEDMTREQAASEIREALSVERERKRVTP